MDRRRLVAVLAAVCVAAVLFLLLHREDTSEDFSAPVEKRLREGRVADARVELTKARSRMDAGTADYLEGLCLLAEGTDAAAAQVLEKARAARPDDWRVAGALASAQANVKRFDEALAVLRDYVARRPDDERGLAALAKYLVDPRVGRQNGAEALALLDRIAALKERVAPPRDPTAIDDKDLAKTRVEALLLVGRLVEAGLEAKKLTEEDPRDAHAWFLVGEAARRAERPNPQEALDAYRRANHYAPQSRRFAEQFANAVMSPRLIFQGTEKALVAETVTVMDSFLQSAPRDADLLILKARLLARIDDSAMEAANEIYFQLRKRDDLTKEQRLAVLRNQALLLYDFKVGGKTGEYLRDAHELLRQYVKEGGVIDESLKDTWELLEKEDR